MLKHTLVIGGCLLVALAGCAKKAPLTPATPWADILDDSLCFFTMAADPSGLKVQYIFDWGNGDTTTTGYFASGDTACCPRSFPDTGTFHIKVRARNEQGRASAWSGECLFHASAPPQLADTIAGFTRWAIDRWYRPSVKVTDPDGDSVSVKFIWSDSTASDWSPFVASGSVVTDSVKWQTTGRRVLRVVLKDEGSMVDSNAATKSVNVSPMAVLWYVPLDPDAYWASPTCGMIDGVSALYLASTDAVESYDLSGQLRWRAPGVVPEEDFAPSLSPDGLHLYIGRGDSGLMCLDAGTGQVDWYLPLGFVWGTPAVGPDGTIYVTTWGSTCDLCRVRDFGDTATVEWQLPFRSSLSGGVAVSRDGIIYVVTDIPASSFRALAAIDSTGGTLWQDTTHLRRDFGDACPPVIDGQGRVLIGDDRGALFCFNPDGSVAWGYVLGEFYAGSLVVGDDDRVILLDYGNGAVCCLNSSGGSQWSTDVDCEVLNTPCLTQDSTTVVSECGYYLTGVGPDGRVRWEFSVGDSLDLEKHRARNDEGEGDPSPLVGPDGNLYVLGEIGLVCIACGNIRPANTAWPTYNHDNARSGWAGRPQR